MPPKIGSPRSEDAVTAPRSAQQAGELLHEAAQLNREDPIREGSLLHFGSAGQLVMTGDLHGNLRNFAKLQRFCDLGRRPGCSVVLHELIHAEPEPPDYVDQSIDLLLEAAAWKVEYPDNVYFLQSNHELSQLLDHAITKGGRSVLHDFERGVEHRFGDETPRILSAINDYIASLPLAARTAKGLFLAHSLPDAAAMRTFDLSVFERAPTLADMQPGGAAYQLVWGRFQYADEVEQFARMLGVKAFIVGHTPQDDGLNVVGRLLVIASEHSHGVFVPIDLGREYEAAELAELARKFVAIE